MLYFMYVIVIYQWWISIYVHIHIFFIYFRKEEGGREGKSQFICAVIQVMFNDYL